MSLRCLGFLLILLATPAWADLDEYVKAPDASYVWRLESTQEIPGAGTVLPTVSPDIELVGKSLATRFVHSRGTVVDTVKALLFEEIV